MVAAGGLVAGVGGGEGREHVDGGASAKDRLDKLGALPAGVVRVVVHADHEVEVIAPVEAVGAAVVVITGAPRVGV